MGQYHKYVFDESRREFVGDFESMYRNESREGFDSWHQEDLRPLGRKIVLEILARRHFQKILDLGCGKGSFTHLLKKADNVVLGLDISETATEIARARYPDIDFQVRDLSGALFADGMRYDLAVAIEVLSYIEDWKGTLRSVAGHCNYALVSLYLPENPIGFVKSENELCEVFSQLFVVEELISHRSERRVILFGKSKLLSAEI